MSKDYILQLCGLLGEEHERMYHWPYITVLCSDTNCTVYSPFLYRVRQQEHPNLGGA